MQRSELPCTVLLCTVLCVLRCFALFSCCITHETVRALLQSSALGVLAAVWPNRWPYASKLPFQRCKILHSPSLCLSLLFVNFVGWLVWAKGGHSILWRVRSTWGNGHEKIAGLHPAYVIAMSYRVLSYQWWSSVRYQKQIGRWVNNTY